MYTTVCHVGLPIGLPIAYCLLAFSEAQPADFLEVQPADFLGSTTRRLCPVWDATGSTTHRLFSEAMPGPASDTIPVTPPKPNHAKLYPDLCLYGCKGSKS